MPHNAHICTRRYNISERVGDCSATICAHFYTVRSLIDSTQLKCECRSIRNMILNVLSVRMCHKVWRSKPDAVALLKTNKKKKEKQNTVITGCIADKATTKYHITWGKKVHSTKRKNKKPNTALLLVIDALWLMGVEVSCGLWAASGGRVVEQAMVGARVQS